MYNMNVKVVRIFNTYGPRMRVDDGRVVSNFIVQALRGDPITIYGDGSQTRSFCFVSDLIRAIIAVNNTDADVAGPFNIGNPQEVTVLELAQKVQQAVGTNQPLVFEETPTDDPRRRKPDITRVHEATGWQPTVPLSEGLASTVAYFRKAITDVPANVPEMQPVPREQRG